VLPSLFGSPLPSLALYSKGYTWVVPGQQTTPSPRLKSP